MSTEQRRGHGCGCGSDPDRYTMAKLPDRQQAFAMKQQRRRRNRRMFYVVVSAYVAAVATVPAAVIDSLIEGRLVWGWPVLGALLAMCARTWEVGTVGIRDQLHEAGDSQCAIEVWKANRIHAKQDVEAAPGMPAPPHVESSAYIAQQRAFWREHERDLNQYEARLARRADLREERE